MPSRRTMHERTRQRRHRIGLILHAALLGALVLSLPRYALAPPNLSSNAVVVDTATTITNWDTTGVNSTTEQTVRAQITNMDQNVLLTFPQKGTLTYAATAETLSTTWKFWTDGDGVSSTGIQAGGSYGGVSYATQGLNAFASAANLANPGVVITLVGADKNVYIYITSRGINAEDFGSNSDSTEAPDASTSYSASMQMQIEWPVP